MLGECLKALGTGGDDIDADAGYAVIGEAIVRIIGALTKK